MRGRQEYPAGVPCWVDTRQADPRAAAEFYGGVFGWRFEDDPAAGDAERCLVARVDGLDVAAIGSRTPEETGPATWTTYVCVEDAAAATARAQAAGGRVLAASRAVRDAGRTATLADPAGAELRVWEPRGHAGAQLVNAPATWNWSNLETGDPEGAIAFYAAVFGWEALDPGFGEGSLMWRLPGYGDVLAARDPSLRERHAQPGVPAGFSDAVGWLVPPGSPGDAARWTVTFAVADADATAAAAARLGGTVVSPPQDLGGVARAATLRDPEGAEFTVSAYAGPA